MRRSYLGTMHLYECCAPSSVLSSYVNKGPVVVQVDDSIPPRIKCHRKDEMRHLSTQHLLTEKICSCKQSNGPVE